MTNSFQALSGKQGYVFKDQALKMLQAQHWDIHRIKFQPRPTYPVVDFEATDPDGRMWWLYANGSWRGKIPGLLRPTTVQKVLARAYDLAFLHDEFPRWRGLITSHYPTSGLSLGMLERAVERQIIHGIFILDLDLEALLQKDGNTTEPEGV